MIKFRLSNNKLNKQYEMLQQFTLKIVRSNRKKSISFGINTLVNSYEVIVKVPYFLSALEINQIIEKHQSWIEKRLQEQALLLPTKSKQYCHGEFFPFLGKEYQLTIVAGKENNVNLQDDYFSITQKNNASIKVLLKNWYKKKALTCLKERTQHFQKYIGVKANSVKVRHYKARWGCCSSLNDIVYNWRLIGAPLAIVDYVVVHELCHILEHNHSAQYWTHVAQHYPNYKQCQQWLKDNGYSLFF